MNKEDNQINYQTFIYRIGLPNDIDLEKGQRLSELEARTGERNLNITINHLKAIPDMVLNFHLDQRDKEILLRYHELKVDNELRLLFLELRDYKEYFIFQLGTLSISGENNDVIEHFRVIKNSEISFNNSPDIKYLNNYRFDLKEKVRKFSIKNLKTQHTDSGVVKSSGILNKQLRLTRKNVIDKKILQEFVLLIKRKLGHKYKPNIQSFEKGTAQALLPKKRENINRGLRFFK